MRGRIVAAALAGALALAAAGPAGAAEQGRYVGNTLDGTTAPVCFEPDGIGGACFATSTSFGPKGRTAGVQIIDDEAPGLGLRVAGFYQVYGNYFQWGSGCAGSCYTTSHAALPGSQFRGLFCDHVAGIPTDAVYSYYDASTGIWHTYEPERVVVSVGGPLWAAAACGPAGGMAGTSGTVVISFSP